MKNLIKETRAAEIAAEQAEAKEKSIQETLDAVEPVDMVGTMSEVLDKTAHACRNEDGYSVGTNGGKYVQIPDGHGGTIAAATEEEVKAIQARIEKGIRGDGLLHKTVIINGMPCDCCGANEEELEQDILAARIYAAKHGHGILRDIDVAEQLVDAGYKQEDMEVVYDEFLLHYSGKYIMDTEGNTITSLKDIKSKLTREEIKTLLVERLDKWLDEHECCCDECDECDDCECCEDDECEDDDE